MYILIILVQLNISQSLSNTYLYRESERSCICLLEYQRGNWKWTIPRNW